MLMCCAFAAPTWAAPESAIADVVARVIPSVVSLTIWTNAPGRGEADRPRVSVRDGSGFVISESGRALTNRHLVETSFRIHATFQDGTTCPVRLIGTPPNGDVALLQIECGRALQAVPFGDSSDVRVGEPVFAVGNPEGLGISASTGVVSALGRTLPGSAYLDYLQTDASINPGNSGGPLFNLRGQVVGMNTAFYAQGGKGGSQGLGFALPSEEIGVVLRHLAGDGTFTHGRAGVRAQSIDAKLAAALGLTTSGGAVVDGVEPDSTAERAGLQTGDAILTVGGASLKDAIALNRMIGDRPGETLRLGLVRDGARRDLALEIATERLRPVDAIAAAMPRLRTAEDYGLTLAPPLGKAAQATGPGLVVQDVAEQSIASATQIQVGDVLLKLGSRELHTHEDFARALADGAEARASHMPMQLVSKAAGLHFAALPVFRDEIDARAR